MTDITLIFDQTDLSSRSTAANKRLQVEALVNDGKTVCLDFTSVKSMSESYADELFGVLAHYKGFEWIVGHISIVNARESALRSIATAIASRIEGVAGSKNVHAC